ncbi:MAG: iron chelate uptake ABC transporter family permease subunit [Proteobacteria bacterium]|nr:iron chelate uptake ABC transporter family permease subunit [Pseudomonadota bacterium]
MSRDCCLKSGKIGEFKAHAVCVRLGSHLILESFDHAFMPGRWTHIIGPNGAGKTTLLRVLCGLIRPESGSIELDGQDIHEMTATQRARNIGYVPQRLDAVPAISVIDFVTQGTFAWLSFETPEQSKKHALKALRSLGMESFADRRLDQLSGGELQLCVLASAMAQRVSIILLDEPTSALDIRHTEILCHALRHLLADGITVISTTHNLEIAASYADQTILLSDGRCSWQGEGFAPADALAAVYQMDPEYFAHLARPPIPSIPQSPASDPITHASPKYTSLFIILSVIGLAVLLICPWFGATLSMPWDSGDIFWQLRIPRVLWGCIAGASLSYIGAVLQALFQNPLATPYTLGIASGASLGTMAAIQFGIAGMIGLPLSACLGGILTMMAVLFIASRWGLRQPIYCLLAGVASSMFCSAAGLVIQAFATPLTAQQMMRWQLGGLEIVGYSSLIIVPVIALALGYLFRIYRQLNLLSVDTELASSRGVRVETTRIMALICTGIATSLVVSVCGPIGFIGLIIPNAVRRYTGSNLKYVLPLSALCGAIFLMFADTLSRLLEPIAWIPVGVVTALFGAPIFIYAILRHRTGGNVNSPLG